MRHPLVSVSNEGQRTDQCYPRPWSCPPLHMAQPISGDWGPSGIHRRDLLHSGFPALSRSPLSCRPFYSWTTALLNPYLTSTMSLQIPHREKSNGSGGATKAVILVSCWLAGNWGEMLPHQARVVDKMCRSEAPRAAHAFARSRSTSPRYALPYFRCACGMRR
jgi:hypothetical protein